MCDERAGSDRQAEQQQRCDQEALAKVFFDDAAFEAHPTECAVVAP